MKNFPRWLLAFGLSILFQRCANKEEDVAPGSAYLSSPGTDSAPGPAGNDTTHKAGIITAGEWNDVSNWPFWLDLLKKEEWRGHQQSWNLYPGNLGQLTLKDQADLPLVGARVKISNKAGQIRWEAQTDNFGKAVWLVNLFGESGETPATLPLVLTAEYQGQLYQLGDLDPKNLNLVQSIPVSRSLSDQVDVLLVVDATGSMGDEIQYLKSEFRDVLVRSKQKLGLLGLNVGSVFYRDQGDEYLTRSLSFTNQISSVVEFIGRQHAGGGGDFPEAVEVALEEAVSQQRWSPEARCRLLFLILDAPPHQTPEVIGRLREAIKLAAKKGIKIIPITASGIDESTEFLMRSLSLATNGTYVFVTDHSGIGNDHLEATVGSYRVEYLNDLMVRLIEKYAGQ